MARRIIGGALVALVIATVIALVAINTGHGGKIRSQASATPLLTLNGLIGSEKKEFFADPRVQQIFREHGLRVNVETAGSRQIATTANLDGQDFVFPASAPAAQAIQAKAKVSASYSPFFSPMAIATYKPVIELLAKNGVAKQTTDGIWHVNMAAYLSLVAKGTRWNQLKGAATLYNSPRSVLINSTDIRTSNSAAMYLSIASYVLNGNTVVDSSAAEQRVLSQVVNLFLAQGYSGASSDEPFQDYLSQGVGAVPMVMIYEAQFVGEASQADSRITDQMVLAYPDPTVYSKHTLLTLDTKANALGDLLTNDQALIKLEAEYGFRTPNANTFLANAKAHHVAVDASLTNIAETPSYDVLEAMLTAISKQYTL